MIPSKINDVHKLPLMEFIDLVKDKLENNAYTIPDKDGTWIVLSYQFTVIKDNGEFVGDVRTHSIKKQGDTE